jgi:hypothetical protein
MRGLAGLQPNRGTSGARTHTGKKWRQGMDERDKERNKERKGEKLEMRRQKNGRKK